MHEILNEGETWVALGFVLVLALLWWKGVPGMVAKLLDQRAAVISAELDEARKLRAEAAALLEDYKKRAATAEAEAAGIVQAAKADAAQFAADQRVALKAQSESRNPIAIEPMASVAASLRAGCLLTAMMPAANKGRAGISQRFLTIQIILSAPSLHPN